jgi:hypothetical protein
MKSPLNLRSKNVKPVVNPRRSRRRTNQPLRTPLPLTMFPPYFADQPTTKYAKLKYTAIETLPNIALGAITVRQWRANDLFDPDYAVGGHQPYGFDQIMAQYNHFTVIHSVLELELMDIAEYKNAYYQINLCDAAGESAAAFAAGGVAAVDEMPRRSPTISVAIDGAHARQHSVALHFDSRLQFRKDIPSLIGNTAYSGTATTSPVEDAYFEVVGYSPFGLAVTYATSAARYTITYWAVFTEPRWFVPS